MFHVQQFVCKMPSGFIFSWLLNTFAPPVHLAMFIFFPIFNCSPYDHNDGKNQGKLRSFCLFACRIFISINTLKLNDNYFAFCMFECRFQVDILTMGKVLLISRKYIKNQLSPLFVCFKSKINGFGYWKQRVVFLNAYAILQRVTG